MTWNDFDSVAPALFATSFALMDLDGLADFTVRSELTGINYLNDLVTVASVPEPNSSLVALLGLAAIAAGVPRRRRLDRSASESRKDNQ
jgi:MYXO-CTERM domain-containing protein